MSDNTPSRWTLARWMLRVTRPVLGALVASTLCRIADQALVIGLYAFAMYQAVAIGVDALSGVAPTGGHIAMIVIVMVVMALLKGLLRYGEQFFGHYVAFKALELLRRETYEKLAPQAPAVMNDTDSGDLLSRITSDIDRIEVFFAHTIAPAISAIVVPVAFVITLAVTTTPGIAVAAAIALGLAIIIIPSIGNGEGMASARDVARHKGQVMQEVSDSIAGIEEVVGYAAADNRMDRLTQHQDATLAAGRGYRMLLASRRALSQVLMLAGACSVFFVGMGQVDLWTYHGTISLAGVAAATIATLRSWEVIVGVEGFATYLANSFASAARIYHIATATPAVDPQASHRDDLVRVSSPAGVAVEWRNVTFTYPSVVGRSSARPALRDVSIKVPQGGWACLVGATGSGKSTLISLLERYWDPDGGHVLLHGRDIRTQDVATLRRQIAVVTQRSHIFAGTIADNCRLANPQATDQQIRHALHDACLDAVVDRIGIDTPIGAGGIGLSGGQIQRLSLARAYLRDVDVFVLDEFTAHLDSDLAATVRQRLRHRYPDATVIEVTHGLDMIDRADHIAVIDNGVVVEQGTARQLLADDDGALSALAARR